MAFIIPTAAGYLESTTLVEHLRQPTVAGQAVVWRIIAFGYTYTTFSFRICFWTTYYFSSVVLERVMSNADPLLPELFEEAPR